MWWFIGFIIAIIIIRFLMALGRDEEVLREGLHNKFSVLVQELNNAIYQGKGKIYYVNRRHFSLYKDGSNQIIYFFCSTGVLSITWKYKFFQQETVYKKSFSRAKDATASTQRKMAEVLMIEMGAQVLKHQLHVMDKMDPNLKKLIDMARRNPPPDSNF